MTNEQATPNPASGAANQGCVCREVLDHIGKVFEVSPDVRQHLANSRVEFLKAIRAAIDQRIEHISSKAQQQGSRIPVE